MERRAALKIRQVLHSQKSKKFLRAKNRRLGEETHAHGKALTSRKGKPDYGAQDKQGIEPGHEKPKGEPDNGRKQGNPHEPSNDRV